MGSGSEVVVSFVKSAFHRSPSVQDLWLANGIHLAVPCFFHLLPSAVLIFLLKFPGVFQWCAKEVQFLIRASICREVTQPITNGIKTTVMLSATCKEMLWLAFRYSHVQDYFFSFAECEQFFNAVAEYLSCNKFISFFLERGTGLCDGISCKSELNATSF